MTEKRSKTANPEDPEFGGPGSSHQDRAHPGKNHQPYGHKHGGDPNPPPIPGQPTNGDRSHLSTGGGERDIHHTHDPKHKS